jgi:glycine oxidase
MISPATEAVSSEPLTRTIGLASLALWPEWLAQLNQSIYYSDQGTLVVAHAGDQAEMLRFQQRADFVLPQNDYQALNRDELSTLEPELGRQFHHALWFQQEACLDNRQLYAQLTLCLLNHTDWQQCEAINELNEAVLATLSQSYFKRSLSHYDAVLDCRGNGAKNNLNTLRSVRGEVIRVHAPEVNFKHCIRLMHPRYPFYLAPRPNHEYVLGATVIESDDRSNVSIRSGLELLSALYSLHKGFAEARILEMAAHCRPALPDHLPTIQQTDWGYMVNGFYRHGYLFAPAIINDLTHVLAGEHKKITFGALYDING